MVRRRIILSLAFAVIVSSALIVRLRHAEPEYQGRKLSEWLRELGTPKKPAAEEAIRKMAASALPFLCQELFVTDSKFTTKLRSLAQKQHFIRVTFTDAADRRDRARQALRVLGPVARPAIPMLIQAFEQGNVGSSLCGPYDGFPAIGPESVPPLIAACTNVNRWIRFNAVRALQNFPQEAPIVVPQLVRCLQDPNPEVRYGAIVSLMRVTLLPDLAVRALAQSLSDPDAEVRGLALEALGIYGVAAREAGPSLLKFVDDPDPTTRGVAACSLVKVDIARAKAYPRVRDALVENLSSTYWWLAADSKESLKKIDGKLAVKNTEGNE